MEQRDLCKKRLLELAQLAERKGIVTFSEFLTMDELHIFHSAGRLFPVKAECYGGYELAERQMAAFIPDALSYEWTYPIACLRIFPVHSKFAEKLTHPDILGTLMSLGIERNRLGDIICHDDQYYLFAETKIADYVTENLSRIRHTSITCQKDSFPADFSATLEFDEKSEQIASNRMDCIIAKAYHLSRTQATELLIAEKVFLNGRCITNSSQGCPDHSIISVRGKGRFLFQTDMEKTTKGKLKVRFLHYK